LIKRSSTHAHVYMALFLEIPGSAGTRKEKPIWILLKQETVSGSGITVSAPRSRQITMPAPHHSVFYRPDALPDTQPKVLKHRKINRAAMYIISMAVIYKLFSSSRSCSCISKQSHMYFQTFQKSFKVIL